MRTETMLALAPLSSSFRHQFIKHVRSEKERGNSVNSYLHWGVSKNQMATLCHLMLISNKVSNLRHLVFPNPH